MRFRCCLLFALALVNTVPAQITSIPSTSLIAPQSLDFESITPGPVANTDPAFLAFGLAEVSIVNDPGVHVAGTDTVSSGFVGNVLVSVNNSLAVSAPAGPLDDHTAGAGWSFKLAAGIHATQFGCLVVDQVNHSMAVETWCSGARRNTFTFTMTGGFPNPPVYFEDLGGFDEVRFQNVGGAGGWGVDNFTIGNFLSGVCPPCEFQANTANAAHALNNAVGGCYGPAVLGINGGTVLVSTLTGVGQLWECALAVGPVLPRSVQPPFLLTPTQTVNVDFTAIAFYVNGALLGTPTTPTPSAFPGNITISIPTPTVAVPIGLSTQCILFDVASPEGFWLTQATELTIN